MELKDLKAGMVVELRDGWRGIVLPQRVGMFAIGKDDFLNIDNYNADMENEYSTKIDIMKVYTIKESCAGGGLLKDSNLILIWERAKEMTIEQISKALGYKVKVVEG